MQRRAGAPRQVLTGVEQVRGSVLVAGASAVALAFSLVSLFSAQRRVPALVLDALTAAFGFVALFWSAYYLGENSGDIDLGDRVIPSGLQQGPVHLAIGASAVLTACGLLALYRSWTARGRHDATPAPILAALVAAILLEIVAMVAPFDSYR